MGALNITHNQLYRMTPKEVHDRLEGWLWRERRIEEQHARWVAVLVQPHTKERVTAEKLLGRPIGPLRQQPKE